jgi:putative transposase
VFFDAIRVKIRDEGFVRNKAIYIALGVLPDGTKEILGIWMGAKFWLRVVNELTTRGAQDILIAVVDGLKGFPEAINAVFPQTVVQTCTVHLIRHSMDFASWKDRKSAAQALRTVYHAVDAATARRPSTPSRKAHGAKNIRRSRRAGVATGTWSSILRFPGRRSADHLHHERFFDHSGWRSGGSA